MRTIAVNILTAAVASCGPMGLEQRDSTPFSGNLANTLTGGAAGLPLTCLPAGCQWHSQSLEKAALRTVAAARFISVPSKVGVLSAVDPAMHWSRKAEAGPACAKGLCAALGSATSFRRFHERLDVSRRDRDAKAA